MHCLAAFRNCEGVLAHMPSTSVDQELYAGHVLLPSQALATSYRPNLFFMDYRSVTAQPTPA